jgi:DNA-directed RNA polymerase specialized sigma24 family protein
MATRTGPYGDGQASSWQTTRDPLAICSRAVIDYDAASSKAALAELAKEGVHDHLMKFAVWRCASAAAAHDLLADAMNLVCDPRGKPWRPEKGGFKRHVRMVMNDLFIDRIRSGYGRFEGVEDGAVLDRNTQALARPADEQLHEQRNLSRMRALAERTIQRCEGSYPRARAVFEKLCDGLEKPAEIAPEIPCGVEEVYRTLEAIKRHGKQVREEWEREERTRMQELRTSATKNEVAR